MLGLILTLSFLRSLLGLFSLIQNVAVSNLVKFSYLEQNDDVIVFGLKSPTEDQSFIVSSE